ncbi:MAG TPA: hypothetical protein DCQ08_02405 [Amoebophilaceae bacterium]|nr:hypothetical protein [Amoebophilaceae bacterium]
MHKGLPIQEDRDYGLVDGYTSPMSGSSDNEETNNLIRAERSQDSILQDIPDDPNAILEAYEETVAFERKILEQINYTSNQKNLRLSQVEQLERQISRIKASAKLSKEERKRIEREVKSNVDLVLNDSNEQDHTIKCKGCKRQMNTSRAILFMLNNEVWGSSTWTLCDDYGNTKEDSPVYESLAAILNAHTSKTHHVHKCAYCYKAAAIENAKRIYERTKQEHDSLRVEFQQLANSANRSTRRLKKLETELIPRISKKVTFYNDQVEAYRNAAIAMESLRHSAILDYEAVKYGPPNSWGSARER